MGKLAATSKIQRDSKGIGPVRRALHDESEELMPKYNEQPWLPPKPSRAQRKIPRQSRFHFVGQYTFGEETGGGQCNQFNSWLELCTSLVITYRSGIIDVREQVGPIYFDAANGKQTTHWLDLIATEKGGRRTGILVKPYRIAQRAEFQDMVQRLRKRAVPAEVDRLVYVTERDIDPLQLARATLFHSCRFAQPSIDEALMAAAQHLTGRITLREFLNAAGIGNIGFHGAVRLIRKGILVTDVVWPLDLNSSVVRAPSQ